MTGEDWRPVARLGRDFRREYASVATLILLLTAGVPTAVGTSTTELVKPTGTTFTTGAPTETITDTPTTRIPHTIPNKTVTGNITTENTLQTHFPTTTNLNSNVTTISLKPSATTLPSNTTVVDVITTPDTTTYYAVNLTRTEGRDGSARSGFLASPEPEETIWKHYPGLLGFAAFCVIVTGILGTIGNLLAAVSLLQSQQLRQSPSTAFMVNLPACLLPVCAVGLPMFAVGCIQIQWYGQLFLSRRLCIIAFAFGLTFSQVHLHTLSAIAFNRLVAVVWPSKYKRLMQAKVVKIYLGLLWLYSALLWIPLAMGPNGGSLEFVVDELMVSMRTDDSNRGWKALHLFLTYLLPIISTSICYLVMFVKMRQARKRARGRNTSDEGDAVKQWDDHVTRTIRVIFIILLACTVPHVVIHILHLRQQHPRAWLLLHVVFWLQFCLDPFIYVLMSQQYRRACIECLKRIFHSVRTFRVNDDSTTKYDPKADTSDQLLQGAKYQTRQSHRLTFGEESKQCMLSPTGTV